MCEPTTIGLVSMGVAALSSGMAAAGSLRQGAFQKALGEYNGRVMDQNAGQARSSAQAHDTQLALESARVISSQKAAGAVGNVDVQSGSVLDVVGGTRYLSAGDVERSDYNAELAARGYQTQATGSRMQGEMYDSAGKYAATASLLGGASTMASVGYSSGILPKFARG